MVITDVPTFWGNVIGFVAVAGKTAYDLYFNPRRFKQDLQNHTPLAAAAKKRERGDKSTALTFLLIGIGYAFTILALIRP
jgi:hypothetical protein